MAPGDAFKALLGTPSLAKTLHFSLHVTPQRPVLQQLTTDAAPDRTESVDNMAAALMLVVPKRHARRAVTRNLVKRQMREVVQRRRVTEGAVAVLIRQRSAFSPKLFPSAASAALLEAVRRELDELFDRAGAAR